MDENENRKPTRAIPTPPGEDQQNDMQFPEPFNYKDSLYEISRHLEGLQDYINSLKSPLAGGLKLRFSRHIQQDLTWISMQTGSGSGGLSINPNDKVNPLLNSDGTKKNVMGYDLVERKAPVKIQDLKPKKQDSAKFADNVKNLYKAFFGMKDAEIINNLNTPGFESLIRGVAKLCGIKDWEGAEIDVELFADIREAIRDIAKDEERTLALEEEFQKFK